MKNNRFFMAVAFLAGATTLSAQDTIPHLTIDSTLQVGDKMTVLGETFMREDATAQKDLKVDGNLYCSGSVFYPNAPLVEDDETANKEIVLRDHGTGELQVTRMQILQNLLYSFDCVPVNGIIEHATWNNSIPNTIFVSCPVVRVAIGLNNPTHTFEVGGDARIWNTFQSDNIGLGGLPSMFSRFKVYNHGFPAALEIDQRGNTTPFQKLIFAQYDGAGTELMKFTNSQTGTNTFFMEGNGRFTINNGIRNTFHLTTDGTLYTLKVIVDDDNWPDYVFSPIYHLRPLSEVRSFIDENGRLPEVPSAEQTAKEGVDIGEMNKILLQKVEELTLYILQQEERIKALEAKPN